MLIPWILGSAVLAAVAGPDPATGAEPDPAAYRAAAAAAVRDPEAQVRLALWCEARGMTAERLKHLALALLADPTHPAARGLMGLVADEGGRWRKPEAVTARVRKDPDLSAALAEYNRRREKAQETEDSQWRLALWCEECGLKDEATAHLAAVVRLNPKREAAWRKLGYKKQKDGRWATEDQIASARADTEAQRKADKHWRPLLATWKGWLAKPEKRQDAEDQLNRVTDPRAVPAIWQAFAVGKEADQLRAVQLLGQVESPAASQGLAFLAVASPSADVRRVAVETLRRRDVREFLGMVIGLLRKPLKYEVRMVDGPGSTGVLFIEGERYNVRRLYSLPLAQQIPRLFGNTVSTDPIYGTVAVGNFPDPFLGGQTVGTGAPGSARRYLADAVFWAQVQESRIAQQEAAIQESTALAQQQMKGDVAAIEASNAAIRADNGRALMVLDAVTGEKFGEDPEAWQAWWVDQQGYSYSSPKPRVVPTLDMPLEQVATYAPPHHSCFGAGTMVHTLEGPRPIESIRSGDRVLAQDTKTGSLGFRPVMAIFHNKPAPTLRLTLDGQPVVVTGIHRFWKAGQGWTMARELKPGDLVRALGGTARVEATVDEKVQPVFNLEVADGHDFFVGAVGVLVHDNSLVRPVTAPFDAPAAVAAAPR